MYQSCIWLFVVVLQISLTFANVNTVVKLKVPKSLPSDATLVLDRALGSLSIELSCESTVPPQTFFNHRPSLVQGDDDMLQC